MINLNLIKARLERLTGSVITLNSSDDGLAVTIDAGPRDSAVGGWCGGITSLFLQKGAIVPREISGRSSIVGGLSAWYDFLDGTGWEFNY